MSHVLQRRIRFIIVMLVIISTASWVMDYYGVVEILERKTVDFRMKICRSGKYPPSEIVLILIDESSLRALNKIAGRWPWPRDILSDLIDFISLSGAKSILMDIMFTENELSGVLTGGDSADHDSRLALSTQSAGNVFHAVQMINDVGDEYNRNLINSPMPFEVAGKFSVPVTGNVEAKGYSNYYLPFAELYKVSKGIGVVSFSPDRDGVYRSEKLLFKYHNHFFPILSFAPILGHRQRIYLELFYWNRILLFRKFCGSRRILFGLCKYSLPFY